MPDSLVFETFSYLNLNPRRRKIFQYLHWHHKKYPDKSFPTMAKIAKFAKISERAVQKFFEKLAKEQTKHLFLTVIKRYRSDGSQTSNQYVLNNNFKKALDWLDCYGWMNAPKKSIKRIISSMQNEEKVHPPIPKKFTPLSKDSSFSKDKNTVEESVPINRHLIGIGISQKVKETASKMGSEYEILEALRSCIWRRDHGGIKNPTLYFWGAFKKIVKKTRGINL